MIQKLAIPQFFGSLLADHTHLHMHTHRLKKKEKKEKTLCPYLAIPFSSLSHYVEHHDGDLLKAALQRPRHGEAAAGCKGSS